MRVLVPLLFLPALLLAGCLGADDSGSAVAPVAVAGDEGEPSPAPAAAPSSAATPEPGASAGEAGPELREVPLPAVDGEFAALLQTPWPQPSCPSTATVLAPTPAEGAWVAFELPEETRRANLTLTDEGLTGGSAFVLCAFQKGALVGEARGVSPVHLRMEAAAGPLEVLVSAVPFPEALINLDALVEWRIEGVALVADAV